MRGFDFDKALVALQNELRLSQNRIAKVKILQIET